MVIRKIREKQTYFTDCILPDEKSHFYIERTATGFVVKFKRNHREVARSVLCREEECYKDNGWRKNCPNNHTDRECLNQAIGKLLEHDRLFDLYDAPTSKHNTKKEAVTRFELRRYSNGRH